VLLIFSKPLIEAFVVPAVFARVVGQCLLEIGDRFKANGAVFLVFAERMTMGEPNLRERMVLLRIDFFVLCRPWSRFGGSGHVSRRRKYAQSR